MKPTGLINSDGLASQLRDCRIGGLKTNAVFNGLCLIVFIVLVSGCLGIDIYYDAKSEIVLVDSSRAAVYSTGPADCGIPGVLKLAQEMAAIATIRQGYERFVIVGIGTGKERNNVTSIDVNTTVVNTPAYSYVPGVLPSYVNQNNNTVTTSAPQVSVEYGEPHAELHVQMLNDGESGFNKALDPIKLLGPEWREKVANGVSICR